jgi:Zn-dependent M28 family amino/carboxypeptidase
MSQRFHAIDRQIVGEVYTSREAMHNLSILCDDFGSRFGGTEGERLAAEFFVVKLQEYGLTDVHTERVPYVGWTRGPASLEVLAPVQNTLRCISLPHSPAVELEGTLIDLGDGAPEEFDRRADEIAGKIVLTTSVVRPEGTSRWIHRKEKYGRSILAGATGFIFCNHYPAYGPATGGIGHDGEGLIPGISISYEDGERLRRAMRRHGPLTVRVTTTDHSQPMTSWNVLGDLRGAEKPDEVVMLGCHYDGHDIAQGAEDPASGAVALLEAARVLALYGGALPRTVRFALWGIEEIGLIGSRTYVSQHPDALDPIRFYLNMDSAGAQNNNRDVVLNEWPGLASLFERWSDEMALEYAVGQSVHAFSDHFPFFLQGVPTGGIQSVVQSTSGRGYGHTEYDTVDKVSERCVREAAALAARLAMRVASEEEWPAERRSDQAVAALLDSPEYREEQAYRERIDAHYARVR